MPLKQRQIDRLPAPTAPRKMKVVIVSASRSGTLGLYSAMQILGYKPIHMKEIVFSGEDSMRILIEGVTADKNRISGLKRYDEQDFRKWFAEYDCIVEVCCFFDHSSMRTIANAYLPDPNVKFILTERDPAKWVKSVNSTVVPAIKMLNAFPMNILRPFSAFLDNFAVANEAVYYGWSENTLPGEAGNEKHLEQTYKDYIKAVKETVPADRLKVIRLEDGLDWNSICPFLGVPVPKQPYPDRNEPEKFAALVGTTLAPKARAAMMKLAATVLTPVALAWGLWRYSSGAGVPAWMATLPNLITPGKSA